MMTREQLQRAAFFLDDYAGIIENSEKIHDKWEPKTADGRKLKREHDEMRVLARRLRAQADGAL